MEISNTDTIRISDAEFHMIADFVYREFGIRFADQKKSLVEGRLSKVWKEGNYRSIRAYLDDVKSDQSGKRLQEMMNRLTTNHSYFFRENQLLTYFSQNGGFQSLGYMPRQTHPDIRIWSAGCSEGQEPYRRLFGRTGTVLARHYFIGILRPSSESRQSVYSGDRHFRTGSDEGRQGCLYKGGNRRKR